MNRTTYRTHRRTLRDNGLYALRWMPAPDADAMLRTVRPPGDYLADRAWAAGTDIAGHPVRLVPMQVTKTVAVSRLP